MNPPTKKTTTKKTTKKAAPSSKGGEPPTSKGAKVIKLSDNARQAALARKAILKATGKKTEKPYFGPWPVVDSGSTTINQAVGGNITRDGKGYTCFGYPRKRISEVYGPEHSGKTTLALEAIVACQKAGGQAMYLDFEQALHDGYAEAIGVDFNEDNLVYVRPDTLEEGMKMLYIGIKTGMDLIVCDSIAAMVPAKELAKGVGDEAKIGARAKALSELIPKIQIWLNSATATNKNGGTAIILINQIRAKIDTSGGKGGSNENTTGGYAIKFFYSLRLKATRIKSEFIERKDPVTGRKKRIPFGNHTVVKVIKNKIDGTTGHTADIFIRHGFGIDDYYSVIEGAVNHKIITKSGSWFDYGEDIHVQGREAFRKELIANDKLFEEIKVALLKAVQSRGKDNGPVEVHEEDAIVAEMDGLFGDPSEDDDGPDPDEAVIDDIEL